MIFYQRSAFSQASSIYHVMSLLALPWENNFIVALSTEDLLL